MNKKEKQGHAPLLSVIVPVYNVQEYLHRCVESILNQTYTNLEVILVNDGSADSSASICEELKEKDRRIQVFHQENQGQSVARNTGLLHATGDFVSFIDSDDWIELNMFESMITFMELNDLEIAECDIIANTEVKKKTFADSEFKTEDVSQFMNRVIVNEYFSVCRRIYRRELLNDLSFIPNKLFEDLFYTVEVLNKIDRLGYIEYPFYTYYKERPDSTMRSSYNLKKLNSMDAGDFLVSNTRHHDTMVQRNAVNYMVKFLSQHYNELNDFPKFDRDFKHRKKIRKTITEHSSQSDFMMYPFLIKVLPIRLYKWFYVVNEFRIKLQLKLLRS